MSLITDFNLSLFPESAQFQSEAPFSLTGAILSLVKEFISPSNETGSLEDRSVSSFSSSMKGLFSLYSRILKNESQQDAPDQDSTLTEEERIQIAYSFIESGRSECLAQNIDQFHLPEEERIKLAFALLKQNPLCLGKYIHNFKITDEKIRIELVQAYAKAGREGIFELSHLVECLQNFQISEAKVLIEIGDSCFPGNYFGLLEFHQKCNFAQDDFVVLVKSCAQEYPFLVAQNFAEYNIVSDEARIEIAKLCFANCDDQASMIIKMDNFNISEATRIEIIKPYARNIGFLEACSQKGLSFQHLAYALKAFTECHPKVGFEEIIERVCKVEDSHMREQQALWIAQTLPLLRRTLSDEQLGWVKEHNILNAISNLPIPDLRFLFSSAIATTIANRDISAKKCNKEDLLSFLNFALSEQGIPPSVLNPFWELITSKYFVKETPHLRTVFQALLLLIEEKNLSSSEKANVLFELTQQATVTERSKKGKEKLRHDNETLLRLLYSIITILEFQEVKMLKQLDGTTSILSLQEEVFKKHGPIDDVDDFVSKYSHTFATSRYPHALITFAGKMKIMGEEYLRILGDFTRSVLNGKFPKSRYQLEGNPHLEEIPSTVLEQWQTPSENIAVSALHTAIDTDNPYYILNCGKDVNSCQQWDGDPNLCCGLLGYLMNGQTRLLAVVNDEGRICSRAIMRLLLDENNDPVIFLERPYPKQAPDTHIWALFQLAKTKAEQMGIPLTSSEWETKGGKYPGDLRSLGGPAMEYTDIDQIVHDHGEFRISEVNYLELNLEENSHPTSSTGT